MSNFVLKGNAIFHSDSWNFSFKGISLIYHPLEKDEGLFYKREKQDSELQLLSNKNGWNYHDRMEFYNLYLDFLFQEEKKKIFLNLLQANPLEKPAILWERANEAANILKENNLLNP